jgi:hypothetical protein
VLAFHSGRKADHSPPSSIEVKEWVELYLHSPNTLSWRGAQGEHRDNFTFIYVLVIICVAENIRPGHESDYSPEYSAEVKTALMYTSTPPIRLHSIVLN